MKICPKCQTEHYNTGTFCSRRCANGKQWTAADKLKKSLAAKASPRVMAANKNRIRPPKVERIVKPENLNPRPCGGYRENSGRGKRGYFQGIYCASTYELAWVAYRVNHSLPVVRFSGFIPIGQSKYYPDFIDGNTIVEIKGYWTPKVKEKCVAAELAGYKVQVLYKADLHTEFEWLKQHYKYKDITELYDTYVPKYQYVCACCDNIVNRQYKAKTIIVFCSRRCAGVYRKQVNSGH